EQHGAAVVLARSGRRDPVQRRGDDARAPGGLAGSARANAGDEPGGGGAAAPRQPLQLPLLPGAGEHHAPERAPHVRRPRRRRGRRPRLCGVVWMLFATGTTVSVPALMGVIMTVGVATANSVLLVTFAREQRAAGKDAVTAALAAGMTRLRPVIMTALAMTVGMLPMSLGLGEGGEQNAPLGRAVIGGLVLATFTTLLFVPVVYSALRQKPPQTHVEEELR